MRRIWAFVTSFMALAAGGVLMTGCTYGDKPQPTASIAPTFGFYYLDEGPSAKLAYGEANSDNVGLMLQCAKGSRMIDVSDVVRSSAAPTLTLASSGQRTELKAEVKAGEGMPVVMARSPSGAPALIGFRRSGRIEVSYAGLRYGIIAKPQERASVERFFAACEPKV